MFISRIISLNEIHFNFFPLKVKDFVFIFPLIILGPLEFILFWNV